MRVQTAAAALPVLALDPTSRTIVKQEMLHAELLTHIDPLVWQTHWHVHSQANPNGHTSFTYLAPYGFEVAISNSRIVCLQDRTVLFTSRKPGRARPRTTNLDAMEFLRRCLQHVLPDGFMNVRHFGFLNPSSAINTHTIRQMSWQVPPSDSTPMRIVPPPPRVALCPTCGAPMRVVLRLWTSNRACVDTG